MKHCLSLVILNVLLPKLRIYIYLIFIINRISVDYLDPLNFRRYNLYIATLLQRLLKDSDYQAHFTTAFDIVTTLISLNNH